MSTPTPTLSAAEREALAAAARLTQPFTCAELGLALWGEPFVKPQSYARPAGRVLKCLLRAGLVAATSRPCGGRDSGRTRPCYTITRTPEECDALLETAADPRQPARDDRGRVLP